MVWYKFVWMVDSACACEALMSRFVVLFVALCMIVIAVSIGVVFRYRLDFSVGGAVSASLASLVMMVVFQFQTLRQRDAQLLTRRSQDLIGHISRLSQEIENVENRLTALERNSR